MGAGLSAFIIDRFIMLEVRQIHQINNPIFKNLQLCYECEFAPLTGTKMNENGDYDQTELSSHWAKEWSIFLFFKDKIPAGFCVVNHGSMIEKDALHIHDIAEFYITPFFRKNGIGKECAHKIFYKYPGVWQVRQFAALEKTARPFWLSAIKSSRHTHFKEELNHKNWSGFIQTFEIIQTAKQM